MASLNIRLAQKQQNEIAKAAAANAMQRKQSVPDLNQMTQNQLQNQQFFSSSTVNLANAQQSQPIYQSIAQQMQIRCFNSGTQRPITQQIQLQQQQQQQQIYGPVLHQQQLQRRSSQPTMGIKITTSRQQQHQIYESSIDNQSLNTTFDTKPISAQTGSQHYQSFTNDYYSNSRLSSMPIDSNNKDVPKTKSKSANMSSRIQETFESAVAARVNSWFNSVQLPAEMMLCRESLMDQIRRGKQLRKVSASNDRSAPKLA
jgi:hypothetical protein